MVVVVVLEWRRMCQMGGVRWGQMCQMWVRWMWCQDGGGRGGVEVGSDVSGAANVVLEQ